MSTQEKYINPFTDFGFKKLFGSELNKDLLISFLNEILPVKIAELTYKKTEHLGASDLDRKVIFDLYCQNEQGEKFIVELQKARQTFFKDRALFYSTFPIQEQSEKGVWNYELKAVYTVAILDFHFDDEYKDDLKVEVKLMDTKRKSVFYEKFTFLYLQMPNFTKTEEELETLEDKWLYLLRNLHKLQDRPARLQEKVFSKAFETAELAKLNDTERSAYEDSLKYYRDVKNSLDTAKDEGREEGIEIGEERAAIKGIKRALQRGKLSIEEIAEDFDVSVEFVLQIKNGEK
jgi:predicted transposase/invertase (TIGR01784 family)